MFARACCDGSDEEKSGRFRTSAGEVLQSVSHALSSSTLRLDLHQTMTKERIIIVGIGCESTVTLWDTHTYHFFFF